jgi:hypothetical protein
MMMLMLLQQMLTKNVDILLMPRQKNVAVETSNVVDIVDATGIVDNVDDLQQWLTLKLQIWILFIKLQQILMFMIQMRMLLMLHRQM